MNRTRYVIGFDIGGTRLKYAAVEEKGRPLLRRIAATGADGGPDHLVDSLVRAVDDVAGSIGARPATIAFGVSGAVDPRKGVVLLPGKFRALEGFPLVERLRKRLRLPVIAENDGRISILAEQHYGQARNKKWVVCLTIGTGVGSGVMLDGRILRDPFLQFGTQIGHLVMNAPSGRLCITGAHGTAETMCSATALAMAVRDGLQRGVPSVLTDQYLADPRTVDFEAVIRGAEQKDRLCEVELRRWTEMLGWLLVSAVHAYAPELIILSGGAMNASRHFLPAVREHVNAHIFRYPRGKKLPIVISKMGEYAGAMGAAGLAWEFAGSPHKDVVS